MQDVQQMNSNLFVGNLSWSTNNESLGEYFSQVGEVEYAKVIINKHNNKSKGYGFVMMKTEEDAQKALDQLNETELDGRTIYISPAKPSNHAAPSESAPIDEPVETEEAIDEEM